VQTEFDAHHEANGHGTANGHGALNGNGARPRRGDVAAAIADWRGALGERAVVTDPDALRRAGTTTYGEVEVPAILRPASASEVSAAVRIARRHGVPVYAISRGKNWGYGSGAPVEDGCAVLDLAGLDRITAFDEEMGTITVEPGVSFRMLEDFLEAHRSRHFMAAPGTTPDASVIGNIMERGWGFGPYSDRFDFACGMEVVLADGDVVELGNARFGGSKSADTFKWGVGPWFDGLFTQSNLGVVTRMTIFLAPLPEQWGSFVYRIDGEGRLPVLLDALRELRMRQILRTNFKLQSFHRVLMQQQRWPVDVVGGDLPLAMEQELKAAHGIGDWNGFGALYSWSDAHYRAERDIVDAMLRPHVDALLWLDADVQRDRAALQEQVKAETGFELDKALDHYYLNTRLIGIDKGHGLKGAYYRKQAFSQAPDLDVDRVGVLWVDPIVPFRGTDIRGAIDIAAEVMRRHGFEKNIGFNAVTERAIFTTCLLLWDRDVPGDDERGMACARELVARYMDAGYTLGRLGNPFMQEVLDRAQPASNRLHRLIKDALDPDRILSPGRYEPSGG